MQKPIEGGGHYWRFQKPLTPITAYYDHTNTWIYHDHTIVVVNQAQFTALPFTTTILAAMVTTTMPKRGYHDP